MCGNVGVFNSKGVTVAQHDLFEQMLWMDSIRGYHSTGVISVSGKGKHYNIIKEAVDGAYFTQTEDWAKFVKQNARPKVLIGHNRWATQGEVNKRNSHPFSFGNISGVHNGTLHRQDNLPDSHKFEVDSENIYWSFHKKGVEWTLERLDGAFALVWYDSFEKCLNFVRNDERPLSIATLTDGTIVWASEEGMLKWLIGRSKKLPSIKTIESLKEGVWKKVSLGGHQVDQQVELLPTLKGWGNSYNGYNYYSDTDIVKEDNAVLDGMGLDWRVGNRVKLTIEKFVPYPGNSLAGSFHCYSEDAEGIDNFNLVITGMKECEFEKGDLVSAKVAYVYPFDGGQKVSFTKAKPVVVALHHEVTMQCGKVITKEEYEKDFDHTCYTCGMNIDYNDIENCATITERNISCGSCVEEMRL